MKQSQFVTQMAAKCWCGKHAPIFGLPEHPPRYCSKCKTVDMVIRDMSRRRCACGLRCPSFGLAGRSPTHCKLCKTEGMTNLNSILCKQCNTETALYGLDGKVTHCSKCRAEGMAPRERKRNACACGKRAASFGMPGCRPICCASCKAEGMMVVVARKLCMCGKHVPTFGLNGASTHCSECKVEGMTARKRSKSHQRMCEDCGSLAAVFGLTGAPVTHCGGCKKEGMVRFRKKTKRCVCGKCNNACFGFQGQTPTRCATCMLPGMVNIKRHRCSCGKHVPTYGPLGELPTHCGECKTEDMVSCRKRVHID